MRADVARTRHQVFDEIARPMAGIGVIGLGRLVERVADAHPGAADELLLDEARIERPAELIGAVHSDHRHFAGLVVDFDFGDQAGVGVAGRRRHFAGLRIDRGQGNEKDAATRNRLALLELRGDGDVLGRDRPVRRALDVNIAAPVGLEIGDVDLEFLGRRLHHHAARLARRRHHGVADAVGAAGGEAAHAMGSGVGIGGVDIDVLDRHAERFGADLPRHRLHALAEVDRGQRHGELAARIGMDQRLARVAAEIHADRIVDRRHAASAKLGHFISSWRRRPTKTASRHALALPPAPEEAEAGAASVRAAMEPGGRRPCAAVARPGAPRGPARAASPARRRALRRHPCARTCA